MPTHLWCMTSESESEHEHLCRFPSSLILTNVRFSRKSDFEYVYLHIFHAPCCFLGMGKGRWIVVLIRSCIYTQVGLQCLMGPRQKASPRKGVAARRDRMLWALEGTACTLLR